MGGICLYLYIAFFKEETLNNGRFYSSGAYLNSIKQKMPNYLDLEQNDIKGCIVYLKGKQFQNTHPYIVEVTSIISNEKMIEINFNLDKEIEITSEELSKQIYRFSRSNGLIDSELIYPPTLMILGKEDFDNIRKGQVNARRVTSRTGKIEDYKSKNDWKSIVDMFEPLENLENTYDWNNETDLSELAFACSKISELKNGMERDKNHLAYIKKYREYCFKTYERCIDIKPFDYRYSSGIAYRHYQNVFELTRQKGRKDGNAKLEIEEALKWFDKSLEIYPLNIKDLSRKGYLILDKKIANIKHGVNKWTRELFQELEKIEVEGIECLNCVFKLYEELDDDKKKRYKKDYIKSLYRLSKYILDKVNDTWNEYSCNKIIGNEINLQYNKFDYDYILTAHKLMSKCLFELTNYEINEIDCIIEEVFTEEYWNGSPVDILYHTGEIYMLMYLVKSNIQSDEKAILYKKYSLHYYNEAIRVGIRMKKQRTSNRNTWHVKDRIARINIVSGDYRDAIELLEEARTGYIRNTLAIALLLEGSSDSVEKANKVLKELIEDPHNLADGLTIALLIYVYKIKDNLSEIEKIIKDKKQSYEKAQKILGYLNLKEVAYEG